MSDKDKFEYNLDLSGVIKELNDAGKAAMDLGHKLQGVNNNKVKIDADISQVKAARKEIESFSLLAKDDIKFKINIDLPKETIAAIKKQGSEVKKILQKAFGNKTKYDWNTLSNLDVIPKELTGYQNGIVNKWMSQVADGYKKEGKKFTAEIEQSYRDSYTKLYSLREAMKSLTFTIDENNKDNIDFSQCLDIKDNVLQSQANAINNLYKIRKLYYEMNSALGKYSQTSRDFNSKYALTNANAIEEDYKRQKSELAERFMGDAGFSGLLNNLSLGSFDPSELEKITQKIAKFADVQVKSADKSSKAIEKMIQTAQKYRNVTKEQAESELYRLFGKKDSDHYTEMTKAEQKKFVGNYYAYKKNGGKSITKYEDWLNALILSKYSDADNKVIDEQWALVQALEKVFAKQQQAEETQSEQIVKSASTIESQQNHARESVQSATTAIEEETAALSRFQKLLQSVNKDIESTTTKSSAKQQFIKAYDDLGKYIGSDVDTQEGLLAQLMYYKSYQNVLSKGVKADLSKYTYSELGVLPKAVELPSIIAEIEDSLQLFSNVYELIHENNSSFLKNPEYTEILNKFLTNVLSFSRVQADIKEYGESSLYGKNEFSYEFQHLKTLEDEITNLWNKETQIPVTYKIVPQVDVDILWNTLISAEKVVLDEIEEFEQEVNQDTSKSHSKKQVSKKKSLSSTQSQNKSKEKSQYDIEKEKLDQLIAQQEENNRAIETLERKKANYAKEVYGENKRVVDSSLLSGATAALDNLELPILQQKRASQKAWDESQSILQDIIQKYFIGDYGLFNSSTLDVDKYLKEWIPQYMQSVKGNSLKSLQTATKDVIRDLVSYIRGIKQSELNGEIIVTDVIKKLTDETSELYTKQSDLHDKIDCQTSVVNKHNPNSLENILKQDRSSKNTSKKKVTSKSHNHTVPISSKSKNKKQEHQKPSVQADTEHEVADQVEKALRTLHLGTSEGRYTSTGRKLGTKVSIKINVKPDKNASNLSPVNHLNNNTTTNAQQTPKNDDLMLRRIVDGANQKSKTYTDENGRTLTVGQRFNKKTQEFEQYYTEITDFVQLENEAVKVTNSLNNAIILLGQELRKPITQQDTGIISALTDTIEYYEQCLNAVDNRARNLANNKYTFDTYQSNVNKRTIENDLSLVLKDANELRRENVLEKKTAEKNAEKQRSDIERTNTFLSKQSEVVKNIQELYDIKVNPYADKPIKNEDDLKAIRNEATLLLQEIADRKNTIMSAGDKDDLSGRVGDFKRLHNRLTNKEYKATKLSPDDLSVNKRILQNEYQTFIESASLYGEEASAVIADATNIQDTIAQVVDGTEVKNKTGELKVLRERLKVIKAKKQVSDKHKRDTLLGEKAISLANQIIEFYTELEEIGKLSDSVKQQLESMFNTLISAETTTDISIVKEKLNKLISSKDAIPFEDYSKVWDQWLAIIDKNNAPQYFTDEALGIDHPNATDLPTANNSALNEYAKGINEQAAAYLSKYKELNSLYIKLAAEIKKQANGDNFAEQVIKNIQADINKVKQEKNNLGTYDNVVGKNRDIISEDLWNDIESARNSMYISKNQAENLPTQLNVQAEYDIRIQKLNELKKALSELEKAQLAYANSNVAGIVDQNAYNNLESARKKVADLTQEIEKLNTVNVGGKAVDFTKQYENILGTDKVKEYNKLYEDFVTNQQATSSSSADKLVTEMLKAKSVVGNSLASVIGSFGKDNVDSSNILHQIENMMDAVTKYSRLKDEVKATYGEDFFNQVNGADFESIQTVNEAYNKTFTALSSSLDKFKKKIKGAGSISQQAKTEILQLQNELSSIQTGVLDGTIDPERAISSLSDWTQRWQQTKSFWSEGFGSSLLNAESIIGELEKLKNASDKIPSYLANIMQFKTEFNSILENVNTKQINTDEAQKQLDALLAKMTQFKANSKNYDLVTSKGTFVSGTEGMIKDIKDVYQGMKTYATQLGYTKEISGSVTQGVDSMSVKFRNTQGDVLSLKGSIDEFNNSLRVTQSVTSASGSFLGNVSSTMKDFASAIAMYTSARSLISKLISGFRSGWEALKTYDAAMTNMSYTMDLSKQQFEELGQSALDMADDLSTSLSNAMDVYQIYANMQTSIEEIQATAKPTLILSNLTGIDASTASDQIQGILQQFSMLDDSTVSADEAAMHVVDVMDNISANVAIDYVKGIEIISDAVQNAGQVAYDAGLSYEQLAAISAKVAERTREDGSSIGNAMKTIITRISKVGKMPSYADEVSNEELSNASASLHEIGVEVYNADGSFRELDVILGELESKWDSLTDAQQSNLAYNIAATRQTSKFKNMLTAWTDAMELAENATVSSGNALANQEKYEESYSGRVQKLQTEWQEFWLTILNNNQTKAVVSFLTSVTSGLNDMAKVLGSIPTLIIAISTAIAGISGLKTLKTFFLGGGINKVVG